MSTSILTGDCVELMAAMPPNSVDAVVCDPPYEIGFMGKEFDKRGVAHQVATWAACLGVLKPGGHLLAFGGSRTYHRMACAVEDAGFEIRDQIMWLYGSGFPKSLDVSKAIDKAAGAERTVVGKKMGMTPQRPDTGGVFRDDEWMPTGKQIETTTPATDAARQWQGWGTALKPAHEPIVVARKPLIGTVASNVLKHGTGALNVDRCRVEAPDGKSARPGHSQKMSPGDVFGPQPMHTEPDGKGRWPANVILDEDAGAMLDVQSGPAGSNSRTPGSHADGAVFPGYGKRHSPLHQDTRAAGGASRFFYCPKASRKEREAGLKDAGLKQAGADHAAYGEFAGTDAHATNSGAPRANHHPTVKPVALMRYLVRLVTPPGGTVLDPFMGSGTTLMAAAFEGVDAIGIEREAEYVEIAKARVAWAESQPVQMTLSMT